MELIGRHNEFFEALPFYSKLKEKHDGEAYNESYGHSSSSYGFGPRQRSLPSFPRFLVQTKDLNSSQYISNHSCDMEQQILNLKIYQPFFISNSTIIAYNIQQDINVDIKPEKFSIMNILESNYYKGNQKLYFKVNLSEDYINNPSIINSGSK